MKVLLLDNYDSFTWNLVQALESLGAAVAVARNDAMTAAEALSGGWERIVVSPGPGSPERAGISVDLFRAALARAVPILGVCLGHQALAVACGARVSAGEPVHGRICPVRHDGRGVFRGLPNPFEATRYHSLAVEEDSLPEALEISARAPDGRVMGIRHRGAPAEGVQFHPESVLTRRGGELLANFLRGPRAEARA